MAHRAPRVFTIPSGAPFLPTLSRALLDGALIDGFPGAGGPMALADATIYVPTQRAAQALAKALLSASGARSLLLPRIAPLGAFEPDETATVFDPEGEETRRGRATSDRGRRADPPPRARDPHPRLGKGAQRRDSPGRRRRSPHRRSAEPALVAATPAQAYALAGDLAALIDDMIIEGAPWTRLETLAPELYDPYWRITLDFLKIAFAHWPKWLAERDLIDRAKRIALLIDEEIKALDSPRRGPTIIAGSTGANRATARLIAAIARAPQGAVVLPDLDLNLDDRTWAMIGAGDDGSLGLAGHPQALLHRLIGAIGVKREDVTPLGSPSPPLAARSAFLSEALRPAESTDLWRERGWTLSPLALAAPRFKASRSSSPTTRMKRAWRWRSPCAKRWRRRASPRRSLRPTPRSRAASRLSLRDGAWRLEIRPGARWGKARPARWPGSSSRRRSSSRRARFSRSLRILPFASAARASNS